MKRWLLAPILMLCVAVTYAQADYLIIVANLGLAQDGTTGGRPGGSPGFPGSGGFKGGAPPGGANRGGPPGGFPGGFPGSGSPPPGMQGGIGGRPGAGGLGGMPPGFPGAGGGIFGGGAATGAGSELINAPLNLVAIIEVKVVNPMGFNRGKWVDVRHHWGDSLIKDVTDFSVAKVMPVPTVRTKFEKDLHNLDAKESTTDIKEYTDLATRALEHGLLDKFAMVMDRVEKKDKNNPSVQAYLTTKANLEKPTTKGNEASYWLNKLGKLKLFNSPHYTVLHQADDKSPEVTGLVDHLEQNMKSFYYWFAMKGKVLPVPEGRFVVILLDAEFDRKLEIFGSPALIGDGYFVRRDNVAIFSGKPLDPDLQALTERTRDIWQTHNRTRALKGSLIIKNKQNPLVADSDQTATIHTYALLQKALEEDWQRATVSYEGTRQLIVGAGLVPKGVAIPQWIDFGIASVMATPKGAPWGATGVQNFTYTPLAGEWAKKTTGTKPAADALMSVVTDQYFRDAAKGKNPAEKEALLKKARTLAWALSYYVARYRMDDLFAYYQELAKLPRDLEFDDQILVEVFAKSFKLMDDSGKKVDQSKFEKFAEAWRSVISGTKLEHPELIEEASKMLANQNKPPAGAGVGRPGGNGPPGGGGQ